MLYTAGETFIKLGNVWYNWEFLDTIKIFVFIGLYDQ